MVYIIYIILLINDREKKQITDIYTRENRIYRLFPAAVFPGIIPDISGRCPGEQKNIFQKNSNFL